MSAVELENPLPTESEQFQYIDVKEGHILVQSVPVDLTPAAALNRHHEEGAKITSSMELQLEVTEERARILAATLSLEEQVRIAYFV